MPINEDKTWQEVGNAKTGGDGDGRVRDAFKNGTAQKRLLDTSLKLYKFSDHDTLTHPDSTKSAPGGAPTKPGSGMQAGRHVKNWPRNLRSTFVNWGGLLRPSRRTGARFLICWWSI